MFALCLKVGSWGNRQTGWDGLRDRTRNGIRPGSIQRHSGAQLSGKGYSLVVFLQERLGLLSGGVSTHWSCGAKVGCRERALQSPHSPLLLSSGTLAPQKN